ncbi:Eukaryotic translation initiation factor 2 subunit beta, partial [Globisporangium splendens]
MSDVEVAAPVVKERKSKKSAPAVDGEVAPPPAPEDVAAMFDLSKKKKKKKVKKEKKDDEADEGVETGAAATEVSGSSSVLVQDPATYSYKDELLTRIMSKLHENNPELTDRKRHTMKPPQLMRVGTKKTLWVNFQEICQMMHRNPEHVLQFTLSELGTEGSIDGNQRLVIRGRYVPKYIESLLRKYITDVSRLYFVHCQDCGSSRSVAAIRSGFHAATRADRRAARK